MAWGREHPSVGSWDLPWLRECERATEKQGEAIHGLGRYVLYCTYLVPLPTAYLYLGAGVEGIETVEDVRGSFLLTKE